jgi:hypothetical protein
MSNQAEAKIAEPDPMANRGKHREPLETWDEWVARIKEAAKAREVRKHG